MNNFFPQQNKSFAMVVKWRISRLVESFLHQAITSKFSGQTLFYHYYVAEAQVATGILFFAEYK